MADQEDKPKKPTKIKKIAVKGKSRKLPKIKLSESQVSRPKKDTGKVPKIGVETNPKAETSRIPLPDSVKAKGLKIGKLAEEVVPHQYTDEQLAEAAKRRTMRVEIAEEMLDEDTIIATPEELGIKPGNRDATIPIDVTSVDTKSDSEKFKAIDKTTSELAKATTAQIDPSSILDDSQEIADIEEKKNTVSIDPATTHTGDTDNIKPLGSDRDELAKATTAKIDPSSIIDDSQPITQAIKEPVSDKTVEIPLIDIEDSAEIPQIEEEQVKEEPPPPAKPAPKIKKPITKIKKPATIIKKAKPAPVAKEAEPEPAPAPEPEPAPAPEPTPAVAEVEPEGIIEGPGPDSDIFKATTMAMDADEIESKIQDEDTAIDTPAPDADIFKAQTMEIEPAPKIKAGAPKTVKLKKPSGAMPSTVKLKKGKPAAPKADTTRVDLPDGAEVEAPKPAKTVKLKKPMPAAKPAGLKLDSDADSSPSFDKEPDFEYAATGTDDGPGAVFSILSLLSLLVSFGVIYFLYSSISLINSY